MNSFRDAAQTLFQALDRLGIDYAVGGSVASSIHGLARATQDLDLVVNLPISKVAALHMALSGIFYADDEAIGDAVRQGLCFNVIHLQSGFKFDLFIASRHPLGREQLAHGQEVRTAILGGEPIVFRVISAEDIVLVKLLWYREGGDVSERQWNDVMNLITVQRGRLDTSYLAEEATRLGVSDLLNRLFGTS